MDQAVLDFCRGDAGWLTTKLCWLANWRESS